MNNYKYILSLFFLFAGTSLCSQVGYGRLVYAEKDDEPIKYATVYFCTAKKKYDEKDSIIEVSQSGVNGVFKFNTDTALIGEIIIHHPISKPFRSIEIYNKKYGGEFKRKDTVFLFRIHAFDYTSTSRGEAYFYTDVDSFLMQKFSTVLYLKNSSLNYIPRLKELKKHGAKAIFLQDNNISAIPKKLFKIKGLNFVDVSGNPLDEKSTRLIEKARKKGIMVIYDD
ncbi:MAG: hypothetical protein WC994_11280 [Brumimicrobium sp.]